MKSGRPFRHQFVEFIPEELQGEILYVSIRFATVSHLCACGCGMKVVTPLKPTDWRLTFDGKTITLHPSIGNWSFPCRSHYWIKNNTVHWAGEWSPARIDAGRENDRRAKEQYYETIQGEQDLQTSVTQARVKVPWWKRLWPWRAP